MICVAYVYLERELIVCFVCFFFCDKTLTLKKKKKNSLLLLGKQTLFFLVAVEQCMFCGREFSRGCDLTKHVQNNACDPKLKECLICGRVLSSKAKLKRHISIVHGGVKQ